MNYRGASEAGLADAAAPASRCSQGEGGRARPLAVVQAGTAGALPAGSLLRCCFVGREHDPRADDEFAAHGRS